MRREITIAILAIQLALSSSLGHAGYDKGQLQELSALLDRGDIVELIRFWNENIDAFSRDTELERKLADLMNDIRNNGVNSVVISGALRESAEAAVSIY